MLLIDIYERKAGRVQGIYLHVVEYLGRDAKAEVARTTFTCAELDKIAPITACDRNYLKRRDPPPSVQRRMAARIGAANLLKRRAHDA